MHARIKHLRKIARNYTANHAQKYGFNGRRYTKLTLSVDSASKSVVGQEIDGQPRLAPSDP